MGTHTTSDGPLAPRDRVLRFGQATYPSPCNRAVSTDGRRPGHSGLLAPGGGWPRSLETRDSTRRYTVQGIVAPPLLLGHITCHGATGFPSPERTAANLKIRRRGCPRLTLEILRVWPQRGAASRTPWLARGMAAMVVANGASTVGRGRGAGGAGSSGLSPPTAHTIRGDDLSRRLLGLMRTDFDRESTDAQDARVPSSLESFVRRRHRGFHAGPFTVGNMTRIPLDCRDHGRGPTRVLL